MLKIAIQGGEGSFHHQAANELFGQQEMQLIDNDHFRDVAQKTADGECDLGLIAIENSIAGAILPNYNLIHKHQLYVTSEIYLPISLNLMALPGVELEDIKKVYSHPIALLQCDEFLERHPHMMRLEYEDTARSARKMRREELADSAAIASQVAADIYDLNILQKDIQTFKKSFTRLVALSKDPDFSKDYNKVSIRFTLPHKTGSLSNLLLQFAANGLNLSKIQSLPLPDQPFRYAFYVDVLVKDPEKFDEAHKIIELMTEDLVIFGKYVQGDMKFNS